MIGLSRTSQCYRPTVEAFVQGRAGGVLLVEVAGMTAAKPAPPLRQLVELEWASSAFPGAVVAGRSSQFFKVHLGCPTRRAST